MLIKRRCLLSVATLLITGCLSSDNGEDGEPESNASEGNDRDDGGGLVIEVLRIDGLPEDAEAVELGNEPITDGTRLHDDLRTAVEDARQEERELRKEDDEGLEEDERPVGAASTTQEAAETLDEIPEYDGEQFSTEYYVRYEDELYAVRVVELM
jgi:hypothetical protein